jgi:REP element-mobilizing transposase RayT
MAKGALSLLKKDQDIYNIIDKQSKKHGVKVYNYANGGNHLHLVLRPMSRRAFNGFIRSVSGLVARLVLNAERGRAKLNSKDLLKKFWDQRPFTRIIEWGRDFNSTSNYLLQNSLEAYGFIAFKPRKLLNSYSLRI